jgi:UDP-glucose 4-epimerase
MMKHNVKHLVFSSSATVYTQDSNMPLCEGSKLGPTNPHGRSKLMIIEICKDLCLSDDNMKIVLLRCFNPIGGPQADF